MAYAFSRDGAMPFSSVWHKVNKQEVPINAVWLSAFISFCMALTVCTCFFIRRKKMMCWSYNHHVQYNIMNKYFVAYSMHYICWFGAGNCHCFVWYQWELMVWTYLQEGHIHTIPIVKMILLKYLLHLSYKHINFENISDNWNIY